MHYQILSSPHLNFIIITKCHCSILCIFNLICSIILDEWLRLFYIFLIKKMFLVESYVCARAWACVMGFSTLLTYNVTSKHVVAMRVIFKEVGAVHSSSHLMYYIYLKFDIWINKFIYLSVYLLFRVKVFLSFDYIYFFSIPYPTKHLNIFSHIIL